MSASFGPSVATTNKTAYYTRPGSAEPNELAMDCQKKSTLRLCSRIPSQRRTDATSLPPPFLLSSSPSVKWNVQPLRGRTRCRFGMLPSSRRSSRSGAPSSRLRLWVVIAICVGTAIVLILFLLSLCLAYRRRRPFPRPHPETTQTSPRDASSSLRKSWRSWSAFSSPRHSPSPPAPPVAEVQVHLGKDDHRVVFTDHQRQALSSTASGESRSTSADVMLSPKVPGGAPRSRIWDGVTGIPLRSWRRPPVTSPMKTSLGNGYGIVYRGVLPDNTGVAIKNLLNNRGQAEKGVQGEVEAIGRVRHKNLVRLLGYCVEGAHRYVAPEYASTGMLNERSDVYSLRPCDEEKPVTVLFSQAKGALTKVTSMWGETTCISKEGCRRKRKERS
ncbi:hypothetical protein HPP92_025597 [Vanilla planifolia]|uniref:Serine-threonine/tyrosine-protein kinase catalytic domain-containing protein n=1 Tax=Vanilla planifolia TaxID=51239 RepID=A0A835U957_VANPL|nr:hypothetical protein HPP92_025597 [Vanilla planifolia]